MTKQQKIDAIYEKLARKDVSFGCKIIYNKDSDTQGDREGIVASGGEISFYAKTSYYNERVWANEIVKIIGHPVMIGDVMEYLSILYLDTNLNEMAFNLVKLLRKWRLRQYELEEQDESCIDFVYSLISK